MKNDNSNKIKDSVKSDDKQREILDFVNKEVHEKGYPPSVREICKAVGFKSTSTVHRYLERLMQQGFIHKAPSKPRALRIINTSKDTIDKVSSADINATFNFLDKEIACVPIIGRVTAGKPILAVENIEDTFPVYWKSRVRVW